MIIPHILCNGSTELQSVPQCRHPGMCQRTPFDSSARESLADGPVEDSFCLFSFPSLPHPSLRVTEIFPSPGFGMSGEFLFRRSDSLSKGLAESKKKFLNSHLRIVHSLPSKVWSLQNSAICRHSYFSPARFSSLPYQKRLRDDLCD